MLMKVAIACGGTGGHLFPGLAVAEVLRDRGHQILVLISEKQIDSLAVRDRGDFQIERIPAIGLPRLLSFQIFSFASKFLTGFWRCRQVYEKFKPDVVLGMGGFTSTGPIFAGRLAKTRIAIHESNAIPGKANRINARFSDFVFLGFAECAAHFSKSICKVTGTPIRPALLKSIDRRTAQTSLRLRPELLTVAVIGGSQGAHGVNEAILAALPRFIGKPVQFLHLTGREDHQRVYEGYQKTGVPAFVAAFHHQMQEVYAAADVVVARSGAASLTEISHYGLPSILLPYPFAADNHQSLNAEIYARRGAAEVLEGAEVNGERLGAMIEGLMNDPDKCRKMAKNMRAVAVDNAADRIAEMVEKMRL